MDVSSEQLSDFFFPATSPVIDFAVTPGFLNNQPIVNSENNINETGAQGKIIIIFIMRL